MVPYPHLWWSCSVGCHPTSATSPKGRKWYDSYYWAVSCPIKWWQLIRISFGKEQRGLQICTIKLCRIEFSRFEFWVQKGAAWNVEHLCFSQLWTLLTAHTGSWGPSGDQNQIIDVYDLWKIEFEKSAKNLFWRENFNGLRRKPFKIFIQAWFKLQSYNKMATLSTIESSFWYNLYIGLSLPNTS